jgi:hypothetical protein
LRHPGILFECRGFSAVLPGFYADVSNAREGQPDLKVSGISPMRPRMAFLALFSRESANKSVYTPTAGFTALRRPRAGCGLLQGKV